jgi:hypothetical protein
MAKNILIRHNPQTSDWEHWESDNESTGYWLPGLYGKIFTPFGTFKKDTYITDVKNDNGTVNIFEFNTGIVNTNISKTNTNIEKLKKVKNINITELIDTPEDNSQYTPVVIKFTNSQELQVVKDTTLNLSVTVYNPVLNSILRYTWNADGNVVKENSTDNTYSQLIGINNNITIYSEITNGIEKTKTPEIQIKPIDLNKDPLFGKNLIKNFDGSIGLSNWVTVSGIPRTNSKWNQQTQEGKSDETTAFNGSTDFPNELSRNDFNEIGPYYKSIISDWNYNSFFEGGIDSVSNKTEMYYDIDVSNAIDIIDKNVQNVNTVRGQLFAYMGGDGQIKFYNQPTFDDMWFQWWSFDRTTIRIELLDENNNILNRDYYIYNPAHSRYRPSLFLRNIDFYIPIGTRTIRVWQTYERFHDYTRTAVIYGTNGQTNYNRITPIPDKNRGYGFENEQFVFRHSTMNTLINLFLYVDNYITIDQNKIKTDFTNYKKIINKFDESVPWGYNSSMIREKQSVYSSLNDKIQELRNGQFANDQIINIIKSDSWFKTMYSENEINKLVYNQDLTNEYDYRVTSKNTYSWNGKVLDLSPNVTQMNQNNTIIIEEQPITTIS